MEGNCDGRPRMLLIPYESGFLMTEMNQYSQRIQKTVVAMFLFDTAHLRAAARNGRFYRLCFKENGYSELIVYRMSWE